MINIFVPLISKFSIVFISRTYGMAKEFATKLEKQGGNTQDVFKHINTYTPLT